MTPQTLHVFPPSPNARKVMLVNAITGLNLPLTVVDLFAGEHKRPEFVAMNPNGKMPILEFEDGSTLWESNAIMNQLAGIAESDLWPKSNIRYDILRWQFWEGCHWNPACSAFITKHIFKDDSVDMNQAAETFHRFAAVLDGHLAGRDWIVGEGMTTADLSIAPVLAMREACHYPIEGYDNILRWLAQIEALPAWVEMSEQAVAA